MNFPFLLYFLGEAALMAKKRGMFEVPTTYISSYGQAGSRLAPIREKASESA